MSQKDVGEEYAVMHTVQGPGENDFAISVRISQPSFSLDEGHCGPSGISRPLSRNHYHLSDVWWAEQATWWTSITGAWSTR